MWQQSQKLFLLISRDMGRRPRPNVNESVRVAGARQPVRLSRWGQTRATDFGILWKSGQIDIPVCALVSHSSLEAVQTDASQLGYDPQCLGCFFQGYCYRISNACVRIGSNWLLSLITPNELPG